MGEQKRRLVAQTRLLEATAIVDLDLNECGFLMPESDLAQISQTGVDPHMAVVRILTNAAINAAYKDGMDRRDGQLWAGWQEVLSANATCFTLTTGQIEWLMSLLAKDELKLPPGLAQWREALIDYLNVVRLRVRESPKSEIN